jgi:hypothetical protein
MKHKLAFTVLMLLLAGAALGQPYFPAGNLNPPMPPAVPDVHFGEASYAYLFYPPDYGSCPLGGFRLEAVHMLLEFAPAQVPVTFTVTGGLMSAVWDPSQNMFVPGGPLCEGPPLVFTFTEPGQYEIFVPTNGACGCQPFDEYYFLSLNFLDPFNADLPTDGQPEPGVVFIDNGTGWVDMIGLGKTAGGKVIIWGDLVCCDPSIGNANSTWGGIKGLYR